MVPPRTLLTTVEAAAYCGFKTTGAIRKAKLEGKLEPAGRRGGKGTWMWSVDELNRFLRGEPPGTVAVDRPGAPSNRGDANGQEELEETLEELGDPDAETRSLGTEGRRLSSAHQSHRSHDGAHEGDQ